MCADHRQHRHGMVASVLASVVIGVGGACWQPKVQAQETQGDVVTLITSIHPLAAVDSGVPIGYHPRGTPVFVRGDNGDYLHVPLQYPFMLRQLPAPGHYQQTNLMDAMTFPRPKRETTSYLGDRVAVTDKTLGRGTLVQRDNGDLIGVLLPTSEFALASAFPDAKTDKQDWPWVWLDAQSTVASGLAYKMRFDGTHPEYIASTVEGGLLYPHGLLQAGPNGAVYGSDQGATGHGRIFRITADDQLEIVLEFPPAPDGMMQLPNHFTFTQDGWLIGLLGYGRGRPWTDTARTAPDTQTGVVYRVRIDDPGSYQVLHAFTLSEAEVAADIRPIHAGNESMVSWNAVIQALDGWIYGTTSVGYCEIRRRLAWGGGGRDNQQLSLCGFPFDPRFVGDSLTYPYLDVVNNAAGTLFRIKPDGSDYQVLHRFPLGADNAPQGSVPRGPLALSGDGSILYGTTLGGGDTNEGVLYALDLARISVAADGRVIDSGFRVVHQFKQTTSGRQPLGLTMGADGILYGASHSGGGPWIHVHGTKFDRDDKGTLFSFGPAPGASVTLTIDPPEMHVGQTATLQWSSHQARDCVASSGAGDWTGPQPDAGSITLQPETGFYNYSLLCIDQQSGRQVSSELRTLRVGMPASQNDGNTESFGNGGAWSWPLLLLLLACALERGRRISVHSLFRKENQA